MSVDIVKEIQKAFYNYSHQRYELIAPNVYPDWQFNEMDIFALRKGSGYLDEIEIKLSKSDFLADFKKTIKVKSKFKCLWDDDFEKGYNGYLDKSKHKALQEGINHCNYFSFLLHEDIADQCEIPDYAGLYVFYRDRNGIGRVTEKKRAKLLHKRKISDEMKYNVAKKLAYRFWGTIE